MTDKKFMGYRVEVVHFETEEVVKSLDAKSETRADKLEDGLNINLDHDNYFTRRVYTILPGGRKPA